MIGKDTANSTGFEQTHCGQWRLVREIGSGAYGVVYFAVGSGGDVAAIKVCRRDAIGGERYGRELRGAKLYSAIPPQEGLIRILEFAEQPWGFYAVMKLADDEFGRKLNEADGYRPKTLASVIDAEKALPLDECVRLGITLAMGLEALQRHHLLHRDIKPGNVIYTGGRPVLSDPGLVVEESEAASLVGTPGYVPPENHTAAASDIYSLGLTLKAASFGRRVDDLDKGPAHEADTGAPLFPAWWRILNKATADEARNRYQSAKALRKDLEGLRRKMRLANAVGPRFWKSAAFAAILAAVTALAIAVAVTVAKTLASTRRATDMAARQSEDNEAIYERALRENFDGVVSDERIKEMARKAVDGEAGGLTPEEQKALKKKLGLDKLTERIHDDIQAFQ